MRLPGFQGTHIPGDHRIVAPAPPQIIIPERKITSAEEAAKWHASRGGAVAEEEAESVLLTDLVAGWALTGGPEQTLDSTGVVASGPLDLTVINPPVTYGASGVLISLDDANDLRSPFSASLPDCGENWLVTTRFILGEASASNPGMQIWNVGSNLLADYVFVDLGGAADALKVTAFDGVNTYTADSAFVPSIGVACTVFVWFIASTKTLSIAANAENPVSTICTDLTTFAETRFNFSGEYYDGYQKYTRIWNGANAATVAQSYRSWLYNSGNGRTDAEVAAYTGS